MHLKFENGALGKFFNQINILAYSTFIGILLKPVYKSRCVGDLFKPRSKY